MSSRRAKDVSFSSDEQACRTMVLELDPTPDMKLRPGGDDATMVLDFSATQIHRILEDTDAEAKRLACNGAAKRPGA